MAFKRLLYDYLNTGVVDMNGIVADVITGGPTLDMRLVRQELNTLSALVALDAETNTVTLEAYWQVSNDATTWVDTTPFNNAARVVWATGTGGADALVTQVLPAPDAVYGWRYARVCVVNRVVNAVTGDTYEIGYCFEKDDLIP